MGGRVCGGGDRRVGGPWMHSRLDEGGVRRGPGGTAKVRDIHPKGRGLSAAASCISEPPTHCNGHNRPAPLHIHITLIPLSVFHNITPQTPPPPPPPPQVSIVIDQLFRLLHACGMPPEDADVLHGKGLAMGEVLAGAEPRSTLFTGSQRVAEKLAVDLRGKVGGGVTGSWGCTAAGEMHERGLPALMLVVGLRGMKGQEGWV